MGKVTRTTKDVLLINGEQRVEIYSTDQSIHLNHILIHPKIREMFLM